MSMSPNGQNGDSIRGIWWLLNVTRYCGTCEITDGHFYFTHCKQFISFFIISITSFSYTPCSHGNLQTTVSLLFRSCLYPALPLPGLPVHYYRVQRHAMPRHIITKSEMPGTFGWCQPYISPLDLCGIVIRSSNQKVPVIFPRMCQLQGTKSKYAWIQFFLQVCSPAMSRMSSFFLQKLILLGILVN